MKTFAALCAELSAEIETSYTSGVTMAEAERLAGRFLQAQIKVSEELRKSDLDARMKKATLKAVKAAVYLQEATKTDKKPSDTFLQARVDSDEIVGGSQSVLDEAEVLRDQIQNYYNIFREGHIHFRSISKGSFSG